MQAVIDHPALNVMRDASKWTKFSGSYKYRLAVLHCYAEAADGGEFSFLNFSTVQKRTRIDIPGIRRASRYLERKGYLQFSIGLWSIDGRPAGAGYAITSTGHALSELIKAKQNVEQR